ncbi:hypothetical protein K9N68_30590 [Kovacikia minuta CCNUW1]|uniref:MvdC/MvdD family ATP grasp protein n=1 Tax=Kovacikia minuta TaxID=2931930 RepID=UPI001CCFBC07|nr:hypothetical protein [Kovacikia minuta]UBF25844.1 hypothetical protein K9N68_30590 [Kovacikia minuta CCNUW1]
MTVLIITHSHDNESISTVMQAIHERGGKVFRFDTDRFPTDVQLDIFYRDDREQGVLVSEQGLVTKMLSSFAVYEDGNEKVVFTNPVSSKDLEDLDGLRFCPMTFQEKVPKLLELRATVVGRKVFTAAVDSQRLEQSQHDWRRQGVALLRHWQPHELPQEVQEKLLNVMDYFGLNYGAIDLILTPDQRYVFLEVNPCGEFFWLDLYANLPISDAIANLLMRL